MKYISAFLFGIIPFILNACTTTGPIQSYSGPSMPHEQIARIMVPGAISLDSIDGKEFSSPPEQNKPYEIQVLAGRHILVFKYMVAWGSSVSGTVITSNLAAFDETFEAGKSYQLSYKIPGDEYEAIRLSSQFRPELTGTNSPEKFLSRIIKNRDAIKVSVMELNTQPDLMSGISAKKPVVDINKVNAGIKATTQQPLPDVETAARENPVKRLKFWWLLSNEAERAEFKQWMNSVQETFTNTEHQMRQ